jgi:hypothetical protein
MRRCTVRGVWKKGNAMSKKMQKPTTADAPPRMLHADSSNCATEGLPSKIDHPPHYNAGKIETITVIEDWRLDFHLGNVVKYISRADHKGARLEDLKKAAWYLQRAIDLTDQGRQ